ncbi:Hsp20/alpha crystallin family protein [Mangrovimicrobium sediminis]|uniref:Hsp20/alpha crystallin family protein n=1 Tax=Mangrovimicrobium sediminis TaxID=2562682 RepID=A0A4Z0M5W5_9GAMM|nr:Hsp20/alpha crystallin family protein [Haliea sp. SAOS-164]TGD74899.1 Hsp20/alpha crystallin family protein [Haliea sp. SAOS-164]
MALVQRSNLFDLDKFFGDQWPRSADNEMGDFFAPRVDIRDTKDHFEITAELPGVARENIHVHVTDGILTLEAESSQEDKEEKEGRVIRQERRYGKFRRSFNLGGEVHEEDIRASFKDGVLKLEAPKLKEKPPARRRIEIG